MAKYTFPKWPGIEFENPTINIYEIVLRANYILGTTVDCFVFLNENEHITGELMIELRQIPVNNFNGDEGNMEDRIWDFLNDPSNGYIIPEH